MPVRPTHSLEPCVLLAYLRGDPGAEEVRALLEDQRNRIVTHKLVLLDLFAEFEKADGEQAAELAWQHVATTFLVDSEITDGFLKRVSRWRNELGNGEDRHEGLAFATALAEEHSATLVIHANVPEREVIESTGIAITVIGEADGRIGETETEHLTEAEPVAETSDRATSPTTLGLVEPSS